MPNIIGLHRVLPAPTERQESLILPAKLVEPEIPG